MLSNPHSFLQMVIWVMHCRIKWKMGMVYDKIVLLAITPFYARRERREFYYALSASLLERLRRFGEHHTNPVVYCDDFGHGENHAIFPVVGQVILDADHKSLKFLD